MKQILLINDVVGYGKVGMGAMLPILSYLGIPTYSLPTALTQSISVVPCQYGKSLVSVSMLYVQD